LHAPFTRESMKKKKNSISIAEAVRIVINHHPYIMDSLRMDIINYSALASKIEDEVLKIIKRKKIRVEAIKIALIRLSETLRNEEKIMEENIRGILKNSVLELKGDIVVLTVKQEAILYRLNEIMKIASNSRFFQLTQGTRTFTLIFDKRILTDIKETVGLENIEIFIDNQSAIIIISPKEVIKVPGFVSYVTTQFARNGINITQIISCHEDTILILNREEAARAYGILEESIINLRR